MPLPRGLIQYALDAPARRRIPEPRTFPEWLVGLKVHLAKNNIPVKELPDGTILAKFGTETKDMTPEMQQENYQDYLDKCYGLGGRHE